MAEILTSWEALLVSEEAALDAYIDAEDCQCEGTCTCEREDR